MNHNYINKLAELYNDENAQSTVGRRKIEKLEIEAVARYITDMVNAVGINRNMDDLPIVIAALRVQADFLMKTMDEDRKNYIDHLMELMSGMSVCSVEIDVAELIKQVHQLKNETEKESADNKTSDNKKENNTVETEEEEN